jgi:hypothetical protein
LNENVADAAFRSLYKTTGGNEHRTMKCSDAHSSLFTAGSWDAGHLDIVRKLRVLNVSTINNDDADEIVLSSGNYGGMVNNIGSNSNKTRFSQPYHYINSPVSVIDFDDIDQENGLGRKPRGRHHPCP